MERLGPSGWHPDPSNPAQLRYYDGTAWTDHVSSAAAPAHTASYAPAVHQSVVTNVVMAQPAPPKSVGLAFLLTFLFGPFGLFYVSAVGAIIMIVVNVVGGVLTFGILNLVLWPVEMVWGIVAAQNANKATVVLASAPTHAAQPSHPHLSHAAPPQPQTPFAPSAPSVPDPPPHYGMPQPPALPERTGIDDPFTSPPISHAAPDVPPYPAQPQRTTRPPSGAPPVVPTAEALPPPRPPEHRS